MGRNAQRRRAAKAAANATPHQEPRAGGPDDCAGCLELHIDGSTSCELGDDCTYGAHDDWLDCLAGLENDDGMACSLCHYLWLQEEESDGQSYMLGAEPPRDRAMTLQLVIWEGRRPDTDAEGRRTCDDLMARYLGKKPVEPTTAIRRFTGALANGEVPEADDRPETQGERRRIPVAFGSEASGPVLRLHFRLTKLEYCVLSTMIAADAEAHGLVCFDPQVDLLRPVSETVCADLMRRLASGLN